MTDKRFSIGIDKKNGVGLFDGDLRLMYIQFSNIEDVTSCENALMYQCNLMNELHKENEQLKKENQVLKNELNGIEQLLQSYRKTIKHDAELLADATKNGYLPPLEDWRELE